ncbi:hypothetical protein AB1Y20_016937 [Prymnesium parvum]|uniref:Uncharacterized protein n=1 Tax=Prymnesium parvum TaxID=97485 RepID=A0AB34ICT7_PRYPA
MAQWKPPMPAGVMVVATFINALSITEALLDCSADAWVAGEPSRVPFLTAYLEWKSFRPIFHPLLACLAPLLPILIVLLIKDALSSMLGWQRASVARHLADLLSAAALCALLFSLALIVEPQERALSRICGGRRGRAAAAACDEGLARLSRQHALVLGLKLLLFACDLTKFNSAQQAEEKRQKGVGGSHTREQQ